MIAICKIEDQLIVTDSTDYEKVKKFYEHLGDGSCKLLNYEKGIVYYLKMLEIAELNGDNDKLLIPIYVSLYQTYKDNKEYQLALKYLWKEYEINKNISKEAYATLLNIADCYELLNTKDFWDIENILLRAKDEAKKLKSLKMEKNVILKQIQLRKKHNMNLFIEILKDEAKDSGIVLNIAKTNVNAEAGLKEYEVEEEGEDDGGDDENDSENIFEENTPDIGEDICLEDISGIKNN